MNITEQERIIALRKLEDLKRTLVIAHSHCEQDHPGCTCRDIIATGIRKITEAIDA